MKETNSIYILTSLAARRDDNGYEYEQDGSIRVYRERIGAFTAVDKAEDVMRRLYSERVNSGWPDGDFGFKLDELILDKALTEQYSAFDSERIYSRDGTLIHFSDLDESCAKKFSGLDASTEVKPGDVVYVLGGDRLEPVYIDKTPFTKTEWEKAFKPGVKGDFTDNSGLGFIPGYGHCHPMWSNVFPVKYLDDVRIPDGFVEKCLIEKDLYYKGEKL